MKPPLMHSMHGWLWHHGPFWLGDLVVVHAGAARQADMSGCEDLFGRLKSAGEWRSSIPEYS